LESEQQEMIRGVVELSDTTVKEVMVPRIDTVFLPVDGEREELLQRILDSGHSRFPVFKDTIDNVVGILYVKDVLRSLVQNQELDIPSLARKPFFVPESKHIDDLLRELRRRRVHIAVAVDEYGGVSGIVCMEDIIEEIVGDIQDEWVKAGGKENYPMTVLVVTADFAQKHPQDLRTLLDAYRNSLDWVKAHPTEAGALAQKYDLGLPPPVVAHSIPKGAYVYLSAQEARPSLEALYQAFLDFAPPSIGGKLPNADFYLPDGK